MSELLGWKLQPALSWRKENEGYRAGLFLVPFSEKMWQQFVSVLKNAIEIEAKQIATLWGTSFLFSDGSVVKS